MKAPWIYLLLVAVFLAVMCLFSCKERAKQIVIRRVLIDVTPAENGAPFPIDRKEIRKSVLKAVKREKTFRFMEAGDTGALIRVRLSHLLEEDSGLNEEVVLVELSLQESSDETKIFRGFSDFRPKMGDVAGAIDAAVDRAIEQARLLMTGNKDASIVLLAEIRRYLWAEDIDRNLVLSSMARLGERREKTAIDTMIRMLKISDLQVAVAALDALGKIGDPRAAAAVIEFSEHKPLPIRLKTIAAARDMGGEKAAAWLFTLSTGHEDQQISSAAEDALKILEMRAGKANKPTSGGD
jgi:hypothetical protein